MNDQWVLAKCFVSFLYIQHSLQPLHPLHRPDEMGGKSFTLSDEVNRVKGS